MIHITNYESFVGENEVVHLIGFLKVIKITNEAHTVPGNAESNLFDKFGNFFKRTFVSVIIDI